MKKKKNIAAYKPKKINDLSISDISDFSKEFGEESLQYYIDNSNEEIKELRPKPKPIDVVTEQERIKAQLEQIQLEKEQLTIEKMKVEIDTMKAALEI